MNIKDLIKKDTSSLTAKVEFKDGIFLHLRYVTRTQLLAINNACQFLKYDPVSRSRIRTTDTEAFTKRFCEQAVSGWEGVTPKSLSNILEVDMSAIPAGEENVPITFNIENLVELAQTVYGLDNFIQETSMEIKTFKPDLEQVIKN